MDGNVSTSQASNPAQSQTSNVNDFDELDNQSTDFDSNPAQPKDTVLIPSILKPSEKVLMPSILKSRDANTHTAKSKLIVPEILKQPDILQKDNDENMRPIILPRFEKPVRKRISQSQVATPHIIVPSIIRDKPISLNEDFSMVTERRSSRTKKPPDKLRY